MLTSDYEKHLEVCHKITTGCLNQPVVTSNSDSCSIVHLSSNGITCLACRVFEFAACALLGLHCSFRVLSINVLKNWGLVEGDCHCRDQTCVMGTTSQL